MISMQSVFIIIIWRRFPQQDFATGLLQTFLPLHATSAGAGTILLGLL
jgi:hypothetical protein